MEDVGFSFDTANSAGTPHAWDLRARGDLDLSSADRLYQGIVDLTDRGATLVVLNLSDVTFVDSTGLRAIVNAADVLEKRGGRLVIDGMSGAAKRVLEITSLLEHYALDPEDRAGS
jgi:anti-sigma B factor antagonist